MTPEVFERNRKVMRNYRINDNVIVYPVGRDPAFGTVVDYECWNAERKVYVVIKMITPGRLRKEDSFEQWFIDTDLTRVEHV